MNLIKRFISSIILLFILSLSISIDHKYFNIFLILIFLLALYEWLNLVKMTIHKLFGSFFLFLSFYSVFLLSDINNISSGTNLGSMSAGRSAKRPIARLKPLRRK